MQIMKMEKLEMDLISKLQSSQVMQKNAYEELENALTLPAKEFEKKYISNNPNENTATVFPSEEQKNGENKETEKVQANSVGGNEEKEKKEEIAENRRKS